MAHVRDTLAERDIETATAVFPGPDTQSSTTPNQRQGWGLVLGLAVVLCIGFGTTLNSISVFTVPITQAFQCSNEEAARVATAFLITMTLAMPLAGWLLDHISPRPVMTAGALLAALGYLLASWSQDISQLTLAIALSGVGVGASTYVPAITLATRWIVPDRQGLAYGILLSGAAIGAIIFPMLLTQVIVSVGWRSAMQAVAGMLLLICVPLLLWLARMPEATAGKPHAAPGSHLDPSIGEALRMPRYWLWIAMQMLLTLSSIGIFIALVPYLVSAGYSAQQAAAFFAGTGAAAFVGNFVFGVLSYRWSAKAILLIGNAIGTGGILCLLAAGHPAFGIGALALFVLTWGCTFNLVNQLSPVLLVESMGQRNFGALLGIGNLIAGLVSALSPEAIGYLVDATHTYRLALLLCAALTIAALLPIALQQRPRA